MRIVGMIIKDDKILLMRRIKDGREYYVFTGGSIENNETEEEALKREIKEEANLSIVEAERLFEIENQGRQEVYYLITEFAGTPEIKSPEKERMSQQNQYYLEWTKLSVIKEFNNLYPKEAINKLLEGLNLTE
ncbi:MAG: NUDIX domain-containing protein [Candidatus Komeilibacteria bacterium]|nr:NUDIX domain-containing protein [Candidatus Komeilibacteria bacterium]